MIKYEFSFEELPDGKFKIDYKAPPGMATPKEVFFAERFMAHMRSIFQELKKQLGGSFVGPGDN